MKVRDWGEQGLILDGGWTRYSVEDDIRGVVAYVDDVESAQLFAASRKMLEMLEAIVEAEFGFGAWPAEYEIRAVISEAKGG